MAETGKPSLRASDDERDRVVRSLRGHLASGRLTLDEFSVRVEDALHASSTEELRSLVADLPAERMKPARIARPRLWPGNLPFSVRIYTPASVSAVRAAAMRSVVPPLIAGGYRLETQSETTLILRRTGRPGWSIFVAVFLFPIGLLALLAKDESQVVIAMEPGTDETFVQVSGTAPLSVRRAVRQLALESG